MSAIQTQILTCRVILIIQNKIGDTIKAMKQFLYIYQKKLNATSYTAKNLINNRYVHALPHTLIVLYNNHFLKYNLVVKYKVYVI